MARLLSALILAAPLALTIPLPAKADVTAQRTAAIVLLDAADAATTGRVMARGGRELNPIAKPFVSSPRASVAYFATSAALDAILLRVLPRKWTTRFASFRFAVEGAALSLNVSALSHAQSFAASKVNTCRIVPSATGPSEVCD